jgi:hypothetical protein
MSMHQSQKACVIPAQPTMLLVGDREISVDEWPMASQVDERRTEEMSRSTESLVIGPKRRAGIGSAAKSVAMFLSAAALPGLVAAICDSPIWLAVVSSFLAIAAMAAIVRVNLSRLRWITFDRRSQKLVIERRTGFRNERRVEHTFPLDSIRAVQLLHNGRHSVTEPQGAGDQQTTSYREFHGYELNLILDGAPVPRMNLASLSDWQWIRDTGGQVAEFLGVPVIDKLYHGG